MVSTNVHLLHPIWVIYISTYYKQCFTCIPCHLSSTAQVAQVQCVVDGVQHLIKMEKALMAGESVDEMVAQAMTGDVKPKEQNGEAKVQNMTS